ncbi:MAG: hypothetical protein QXT63_06715 [Thermoplasmata archaeon]
MISHRKIEFGKRFTISCDEKVIFDDIVMTYTGEGKRIIIGDAEKSDRVARYAEFLLERKGEFEWLRIYENIDDDGAYGKTAWDRYTIRLLRWQDDGRAISLVVLKDDKKERKFRLGQEFSLAQDEIGICDDLNISFVEGDSSYILLKVSKENAGKECEKKEIRIDMESMERCDGYNFYLRALTITKKGIIARLRIDK